ncbi:MAG: SIR2 family NAD-dependent protein deacylase [Candidatus Hodarchaeales archaeon]
MNSNIERAVELISKSKYIVAFTGAGISTDSGIPDFRSPGGLWERFDPQEYATLKSFLNHPEKFWSMHEELTKTVLQSKPNDAHRFLVELEKLGKLKSIITQNIDFLHSRAGSQRIIKLYGSGEEAICLSCNKTYLYSEFEKLIQERGIPPRCPVCKGLIKPNVVLFGEPLPDGVYNKASTEVSQSDLLIVIGSSLSVYPAALIPQQAVRTNTKIIIMNRNSTPLDSYADIVIRGSAAEISKTLIHELSLKTSKKVET